MKHLILSILASSNLFAQADSLKTQEPAEEKVPSWEKSFGLGLSLSHALNINPPSGTSPKSGFSSANSVDATMSYTKEGSRFKMLNDFTWLTAFFRAKTTDHTSANSDVININHDISYSTKKKGEWYINTILNETSPILTAFDNNYLKDYAATGAIQKFWNPYTITISPGIKYQPNKYLGISISPYSIALRGVTVQSIADKDLHFTDNDDRQNASGQYKKGFSERLGAATNIWYIRKFKKKVDLNYKLNLSTNYFEDIFKNGKINGQFSTNFNIFKGFSISHKAFLKGNLASKPLKLNYNQVILFGYKLNL